MYRFPTLVTSPFPRLPAWPQKLYDLYPFLLAADEVLLRRRLLKSLTYSFVPVIRDFLRENANYLSPRQGGLLRRENTLTDTLYNLSPTGKWASDVYR